MFITALIGTFLAIITVAIHVVGFDILFKAVLRLTEAPPTRGLPIAMQIMRTAWLLLFFHALEIGMWAFFFRYAHCFPDVESAFYFSGSTYTSVGYGDLLLPTRWRLLGPIESLTGMLMCGLSASAFFALITRIAKARSELMQAELRSVS